MKGKKGSGKHTTAGPAVKVPKAKPLHKTSFYLDLKGYNGLISLTNDIESLGGGVETFLSKDVKYVVTNRPNWKQHLQDSSADSSASPIFTPNSLSKSGISPYTLESTSDKSNAKTVNSRASALLEKARMSMSKGSSDVLQIARLWGVKVVPVNSFLNWIKKLKSQTRIEHIKGNTMNTCKLKTKSQHSEIKLVSPFLKFEDVGKQYRPIFKQFRVWPILNIGVVHTQSPFMTAQEVEKSGKKSNINGIKFSSAKLVSEGNQCQESKLSSSSCHLKSTASKEVLGLKPGYCEMCCCRYDNLLKHIKTATHRAFLEEPGFYVKLDQKIASLPDIMTLAKTHTKCTSSSHQRSNIASDAQMASCAKESCGTLHQQGKIAELTERGKRKLTSESGGIFVQKLASPNKGLSVKQPLQKRLRAISATSHFCEVLNCVTTAEENISDVNNKECIENNASQGSVFNHSGAKVDEKNRKNLKRTLTDENNCGKITTLYKSIGESPNIEKMSMKRKVLESRDLNVNSAREIACNSILKPWDDVNKSSFLKEQENYSFDVNTVSSTAGNRVLRSTAQRRLYTLNHPGEICSSPTILTQQRNSVSNSRKIKSSPISTTAVNLSDRCFKSCRALSMSTTSAQKKSSQKRMNSCDKNVTIPLCTALENDITHLSDSKVGCHITNIDSAPVKIEDMNADEKLQRKVAVNPFNELAGDYNVLVSGDGHSQQTERDFTENEKLLNEDLTPPEEEGENENLKFDTSLDLTTIVEDCETMVGEILPSHCKHLETVLHTLHPTDGYEKHSAAHSNSNGDLDKCKLDRSSEVEDFHTSTDYLSNFISDDEDKKFDEAVDTFINNKIASLESGSQECQIQQPIFNTTLRPGITAIVGHTITTATTECGKTVPKYILRRVKGQDMTQWTVHMLET